MSCYNLCSTSACGINYPQPLADSCNELCVRQWPDSTTTIQPPPVIITFPGPILSSFPQDSVVASSGAPVLGGYGGSSLGCGGLYGYGGSSLGCGGLYGYGRSYGSGSCSPYSYWYNRYIRDSCWPC